MSEADLEAVDEYPEAPPHVFFSLLVKPGHDGAVVKLLGKLVEFCDETGAGWAPTDPHRIPGHASVVLTIQFTGEAQKQAFLRLPEYHDLRIDLIDHCRKGGVSVLK